MMPVMLFQLASVWRYLGRFKPQGRWLTFWYGFTDRSKLNCASQKHILWYYLCVTVLTTQFKTRHSVTCPRDQKKRIKHVIHIRTWYLFQLKNIYLRLNVYICLSWNKYHVLFCSVINNWTTRVSIVTCSTDWLPLNMQN